VLNCGELENQPRKPTVCLVASDFLHESVDLTELVHDALNVGCGFFITWGAAADLIHERLDAVIEEMGGEFLHTVTMSFKDEPIDDVAWFLVNGAFPGESILRCCVVVAKPLIGLNQLLAQVQGEINKYNLSHPR